MEIKITYVQRVHHGTLEEGTRVTYNGKTIRRSKVVMIEEVHPDEAPGRQELFSDSAVLHGRIHDTPWREVRQKWLSSPLSYTSIDEFRADQCAAPIAQFIEEVYRQDNP